MHRLLLVRRIWPYWGPLLVLLVFLFEPEGLPLWTVPPVLSLHVEPHLCHSSMCSAVKKFNSLLAFNLVKKVQVASCQPLSNQCRFQENLLLLHPLFLKNLQMLMAMLPSDLVLSGLDFQFPPPFFFCKHEVRNFLLCGGKGDVNAVGSFPSNRCI